MTLYDELGVAPSATAAEIGRAYRRRAKKAHPDHGGDRAEFERLAHAKAVLADPDRRRRYDETGDEGAANADRELAAVLDILARALDAAIQAAMQDLSRVNVLALARLDIAKQRGALDAKCGQIRVIVEKYEAVAARFRAPKGKPDRVGAIMRARLSDARRQLAAIEGQAATLDKAAAMLEGYEYRTDAPLGPQGFAPLGLQTWNLGLR
jgi:curved DNA-binding protein CbpA